MIQAAPQTTASRPQFERERYTSADLHTNVRSLHLSRWRLLNPGWICIIAAFLLSVVGILAIGTTAEDYALRQVMHLCLGLICAAVVAMPHYKWLEWMSYPLLLFTIALLIFVLIPFIPEAIVRPRNNARRWINFVVMDFQPSELAKIAYVIALAGYLKFRSSYRTLRGLAAPLILTFIPMALIVVEPDLGTSLVFIPTLFAMLIAAGARLKHLILIALLGVACAPMMYPILKPHQKNRIKSLIAQVSGDDRYIDDIGFQGDKAMTIVGAGGFSGVGREHAADLVKFNALPEEHNDMIFAVVCVRWGMLGAVAMWGLYALLAGAALLVAGQARDPFARLVPIGLVAVLIAQMIINTGMTMGLFPITGMTLPFVSYGGSSLLTSWVMIGLILNIALRRDMYMTRESFEFDDNDEYGHAS